MSRICIKFNVVLMITALALVGCDSPYIQKPPDIVKTAVTAKNRWRASGNVSDAGNAVDANPSTAAVASHAGSGATLTVDLSRPCMFNMVVVNHGPNGHGYATQLELATSTDGKIFTTRKTVYGTRKVTTVLLIRPILARYVRLKVLQSGPKPWSAAEIYIQ